MSPREIARERGDKFYIDSKPCRHGHASERVVSDGRCVECNRVRAAEWREKNIAVARERERVRSAKRYAKTPELAKEYSQRWQEKRPEYQKEYRTANRGALSARERAWRERNPDKVKAYADKYRAANVEPIRARANAKNKTPEGRLRGRIAANARHAMKLQRTPAWADASSIEEIYKQCPSGMEVDHIVPLQGKLVSGLHVANNLQYLSKVDNVRKGNKFEVQDA